VTFGNLRTQQISSIIFQCSMLYHTEFDFLWLFIHLCPRKKPCIFLSFKGNITWTCAVGPFLSPLCSIYFICTKSSHRFLLIFSQLLRILLSLKLWNKSWGSPCSFKRKGAFISLLSLVWGKSLTFYMARTRVCTLMTWKSCAVEMRNVILKNHLKLSVPTMWSDVWH